MGGTPKLAACGFFFAAGEADNFPKNLFGLFLTPKGYFIFSGCLK